MIRAYREGRQGFAQSLLERKDIDVNANDNEGRMDHERVVKLLLTQSNIEPKTKDKYGCTALMLAIMGGYRSIVKLLLAQDGVEVNVKVTTEKQHS